MKTYSPKASDLRPRWHVIDATDQTLGRLAVRIAQLLKGKHKPIYSPHMLTGDFVVVINSRRIRVSGKKTEEKMYYRHSQYPGGLKQVPLSELLVKHPDRAIEHAVKGMLPHNSLGRHMLQRLKSYPDSTHPHEAQVAASTKAVEKEKAEGVVWIGLPKPVFRKHARQKKAKAPIAETVVATPPVEAPQDAEPPQPSIEVVGEATSPEKAEASGPSQVGAPETGEQPEKR